MFVRILVKYFSSKGTPGGQRAQRETNVCKIAPGFAARVCNLYTGNYNESYGVLLRDKTVIIWWHSVNSVGTVGRRKHSNNKYFLHGVSSIAFFRLRAVFIRSYSITLLRRRYNSHVLQIMVISRHSPLTSVTMLAKWFLHRVNYREMYTWKIFKYSDNMLKN